MQPNETEQDYDRFVGTKEVTKMVCLSKREIDRRIAQKRFPKSIRLGHRTVAWKLSDIRAWQNEQAKRITLAELI